MSLMICTYTVLKSRTDNYRDIEMKNDLKAAMYIVEFNYEQDL